MADDDRDTERDRARLQEIAWGSGSTPAEAARARITLADLGRRGGRRGPTAADTPPQPEGASRPVVAAAPTAGPTAAPAATPGATRASVASVSSSGDRLADGAVPGQRDPGLPSERPDQPVDATESAPATALVDTTRQADATRQVDTTQPAGSADGPSAPSRWVRGRDRVLRVVRSARTRPWLAGGLAAAIVVAFGTGLVIGTVHPAVPGSPSVTPTAGTVTLQQLLDAPQTYADQIPGSIEAPVRLHSTRLIFTNRSLSGDDAATPWNVWAGVGADRSMVCLVATANRMEASTSCFPRDDALHGKVSMTAQSLSGTLTLELSGGGVDGRVAQAF
ncbi:hypothetical protein [Curtobacterium sp. VKM Ac-2922]|uniref:hypothetical protein n=1 Tax=Curtobacterium sp. VKM Ac-2922 TaxID=2929475 RepID=UPI001FB1DBC1|nr:hypothetical protein [Curtobacterium sp. VKM Ac-2922]MCJ1714874.1 hypothetical protein [Curtobacterium sp. VKM Ac-2922]